jgi:hypothetical protein
MAESPGAIPGVTTTVRIVTEGMEDPLKGGRGPWAVPGLENGTKAGSVLQDRRGGQGQRRIDTGPQGARESVSLCARVQMHAWRRADSFQGQGTDLTGLPHASDGLGERTFEFPAQRIEEPTRRGTLESRERATTRDSWIVPSWIGIGDANAQWTRM